MKKDLKPCPFCCGPVKVRRLRGAEDINAFLCNTCGAIVSFAGGTSLAERAWNRRDKPADLLN